MDGPKRQLIGPHLVAGRGEESDAVEILTVVLRYAVIVLAIVAIVWVVRSILRSRSRSAPTPWRSAGLDELDLRYARGEVDHADYMERRANLMAGRPAPPLPAAPAAAAPPAEPPAAT